MASVISVIATANGKETDGSLAVFSFNRTGDLASALRVSYQLFGTAKVGSDYTGNTTGTITFAAGNFIATLSLPALADGGLIDPYETIIARINPAADYEIATGKQFATATIEAEGMVVIPNGVRLPGSSSGEQRNLAAFAVLKSDGSVVSWGDSRYGGNAPADLTGVTQIFSTESAFAALKSDGSVASWGSGSAANTPAGLTGVVGFANPYTDDRLVSAATATYALTPSATTINEGAALTSTVTSTNVATGTKLYYALRGTGITASDFSAGALTGEGVTDATGKFVFSNILANDLVAEGTGTLSITLFSDSNRLIKIGETNVSIVDYAGGSTDYSYSLSKLSGLTSSNSLTGAFENFQFFNLGGNRQGIQKKGTGAIDEITGVSTLVFNDSTISVLDGIIGVFNQVTGKETKDAQMFRLYNASFNRFPDSSGLKYRINEYSKGITDYRNIAESFIRAPRKKSYYLA